MDVSEWKWSLLKEDAVKGELHVWLCKPPRAQSPRIPCGEEISLLDFWENICCSCIQLKFCLSWFERSTKEPLTAIGHWTQEETQERQPWWTGRQPTALKGHQRGPVWGPLSADATVATGCAQRKASWEAEARRYTHMWASYRSGVPTEPKRRGWNSQFLRSMTATLLPLRKEMDLRLCLSTNP